MLEVAMPLINNVYMFDQYDDDDHIRIMAEELPSQQQRHEEIFHLLDEHWMDGILIDSGATSGINIINMDPRSKGKYGAFMLVSKIVPLATASTFTTYGGNVSDLFGEAVLMMELPRRHSTPSEGGRFAPIKSTEQRASRRTSHPVK
jgi:hypothetical protein